MKVGGYGGVVFSPWSTDASLMTGHNSHMQMATRHAVKANYVDSKRIHK